MPGAEQAASAPDDRPCGDLVPPAAAEHTLLKLGCWVGGVTAWARFQNRPHTRLPSIRLPRDRLSVHRRLAEPCEAQPPGDEWCLGSWTGRHGTPVLPLDSVVQGQGFQTFLGLNVLSPCRVGLVAGVRAGRPPVVSEGQKLSRVMSCLPPGWGRGV